MAGCGVVVCGVVAASASVVRRGGWPYVAYMAYVRKDRRPSASRAVGIIILPWP